MNIETLDNGTHDMAQEETEKWVRTERQNSFCTRHEGEHYHHHHYPLHHGDEIRRVKGINAWGRQNNRDKTEIEKGWRRDWTSYLSREKKITGESAVSVSGPECSGCSGCSGTTTLELTSEIKWSPLADHPFPLFLLSLSSFLSDVMCVSSTRVPFLNDKRKQEVDVLFRLLMTIFSLLLSCLDFMDVQIFFWRAENIVMSSHHHNQHLFLHQHHQHIFCFLSFVTVRKKKRERGGGGA